MFVHDPVVPPSGVGVGGGGAGDGRVPLAPGGPDGPLQDQGVRCLILRSQGDPDPVRGTLVLTHNCLLVSQCVTPVVKFAHICNVTVIPCLNLANSLQKSVNSREKNPQNI